VIELEKSLCGVKGGCEMSNLRNLDEKGGEDDRSTRLVGIQIYNPGIQFLGLVPQIGIGRSVKPPPIPSHTPGVLNLRMTPKHL
jgi:hypothetical protein